MWISIIFVMMIVKWSNLHLRHDLYQKCITKLGWSVPSISLWYKIIKENTIHFISFHLLWWITCMSYIFTACNQGLCSCFNGTKFWLMRFKVFDRIFFCNYINSIFTKQYSLVYCCRHLSLLTGHHSKSSANTAVVWCKS